MVIYSRWIFNIQLTYIIAPKSLVIDRSMYSSTLQAVFPESAPQRKLTHNFRDKVNYVVHCRNLKVFSIWLL